MLHHGHIADSMNLSSLKTIAKSNNKYISESNNYRAIALSSVIDKLYASEVQFGFKPQNSTTTQCTS